MIWPSLLIVALMGSGYCATVNDSNTFVDTVFNQKMPPLIRLQPDLYPSINMTDFDFIVSRSAITNRRLRVNDTRGVLVGLDNAIHRFGDCGPPVIKQGNRSVLCNIQIHGINGSFTANTRGDNVFLSEKHIWFRTTLGQSVGTFEATASPGKPPSVYGFVLDSLNIDVTYDHELILNQRREDEFLGIIRQKVKERLFEVLYGKYRQLLEVAVSTASFPSD